MARCNVPFFSIFLCIQNGKKVIKEQTTYCLVLSFKWCEKKVNRHNSPPSPGPPTYTQLEVVEARSFPLPIVSKTMWNYAK